jgi:hypothetical protein
MRSRVVCQVAREEVNHLSDRKRVAIAQISNITLRFCQSD